MQLLHQSKRCQHTFSCPNPTQIRQGDFPRLFVALPKASAASIPCGCHPASVSTPAGLAPAGMLPACNHVLQMPFCIPHCTRCLVVTWRGRWRRLTLTALSSQAIASWCERLPVRAPPCLSYRVSVLFILAAAVHEPLPVLHPEPCRHWRTDTAHGGPGAHTAIVSLPEAHLAHIPEGKQSWKRPLTAKACNLGKRVPLVLCHVQPAGTATTTLHMPGRPRSAV